MWIFSHYKFSSEKYFTDDIRSNFSEKVNRWYSFKEGEKLLRYGCQKSSPLKNIMMKKIIMIKKFSEPIFEIRRIESLNKIYRRRNSWA